MLVIVLLVFGGSKHQRLARVIWATRNASSSLPTLLICGDHDIRAPLIVADHLRQAIIGSTLVVLPGAGHLCNIEAASAFNDAVRAFLLDP